MGSSNEHMHIYYCTLSTCSYISAPIMNIMNKWKSSTLKHGSLPSPVTRVRPHSCHQLVWPAQSASSCRQQRAMSFHVIYWQTYACEAEQVYPSQRSQDQQPLALKPQLAPQLSPHALVPSSLVLFSDRPFIDMDPARRRASGTGIGMQRGVSCWLADRSFVITWHIH